MTVVLEDEPDLVVYAYSPGLYNALQGDLKANDLGSLMRWRDELAAIAAIISDVDQRLPALGLTLPRLVELVQRAWEEEDSHPHRWWKGDFQPSRKASSPAMRALIVNLHLRGLPRDRITYALSVDPAWVDAAIAEADIDDKDRAVVAAHLAGKTWSQIVKETATPRTTVERILDRRLGEAPRRQYVHKEIAMRRREVRRLRAEGRTVKEICELLGLSKDTVMNDLRGGHRGPAE